MHQLSSMQQVAHNLILASHPGDNVLDRFFEAGGTAAVFTVMVIVAVVAHRRANRQLRQARTAPDSHSTSATDE